MTDSRLDDTCRRYVSQLREAISEVRVSTLLNQGLVRPLATGCAFSVPRETSIDDFHAFDDPPNRREALLVQEPVALISRVDEDLRRSGVGASRREDNCPTLVRRADWVIL